MSSDEQENADEGAEDFQDEESVGARERIAGLVVFHFRMFRGDFLILIYRHFTYGLIKNQAPKIKCVLLGITVKIFLIFNLSSGV